MNEISYQKNEVIKRLKDDNALIISFTASIRSRATYITTSSTVIVTLITAANFLPPEPKINGVLGALLAMVCLCSVAIYWQAAKVWQCNLASLAGTDNLAEVYQDYISLGEDKAIFHFIRDLCATSKENSIHNSLQAKNLEKLILIFMLQLMLLTFAIGWTAISEKLVNHEIFIWVSGISAGVVMGILYAKNR